MPRRLLSLMLAVLLLAPLTAPAVPAVALPLAPAAPSGLPDDPTPIRLTRIGRYNPGPYRSADPRAAEIVTFDPASQRMFIINSFLSALQIVDIANPAAPVLLHSIAITPTAAFVPNSVAVRDGLVAVAANAETRTDPGRVVFFTTDGVLLNQVTVGAVPDMVTFTPDGRTLLVAGEGEPSSYGQPDSQDPEGTVALIRLPAGGPSAITTTSVLTASLVRFTDFNVGGPRHAELDPAIRITGPQASVAQDLEPEYIAVAPDSRTAYVTLQENNALATIDLVAARVTSLRSLGFKSHAVPGQGLDPSDSDGANLIAPWPVYGMYQPDTIAAFSAQGQLYLATANEGDARDYLGFVEEARVKTLTLDTAAFTDAATLKLDANLGRLTVSKASGDADGDGDIERLYAFGARSFSIWDAASGALVADSGDDMEVRSAAAAPANFNANNTANTRDNRSDDKGPEPEALALGAIDGRTYAFVGLERMGGVMAYDVTEPARPTFVAYELARAFPSVYADGTPDDLGPESLTFVSAGASPTGQALLLVANEVSGSVSIYAVTSRAPDIELAIDDGTETTQPGATLAYTIAFTNTAAAATRPAQTLVISAQLAPQLTYQACAFREPAIGACAHQDGVVTFTLTGELPAGQGGAAQLTATVASPAAGAITTTATLTYRDNGRPRPQRSAADSDQVLLPPAITSGAPPAGRYGAPYLHTVRASGIPTPTLSVSGTLPAGLSFDPATGILSGTPTLSGDYAFVFQASGSAGPAATQAVSLTIDPAPLTITAMDATRRVGSANPAFSVAYAGFVFADDASVLITPATITTTATIASPPGAYPLIPSGATARNYTISVVPGTLTITNAAVYLPVIVR
jgi:hypothetical protein